MKANPKPSDFAALIGIDWADKKHDICEIPGHSDTPIFSVINASPKSITDWALELRSRYPGKKVAVACELKKGPLVYALERFDHIVLFPLNPSTVANYRKTFTTSGAKGDPSDALVQAELLLTHMNKFKPLFADDPQVRALGQLTEYRRSLVQTKVDFSNKITSALKNYYPHVLQWFQDKDTDIFCDFVSRWPCLEAAKKARKTTLQKFFNEHNSRYPDVNDRRIREIRTSVPLTTDPGVIEPNKMLVEILIEHLRLLLRDIEKLDKEIKKIYRSLPDREIFDSLPGAGPQMAPRLLTAFGTNRDRYQNAAELQRYGGVAPVIESSGQKSWTHWRYSCPKFLRQTFVEWAGLSIRFSFWAKAYYDQQIAKGKPHNTAVRSLAFKWIRIVYKCWIDRKPYDESKYLEALKMRGSPLLEFAVKNEK
jgi:transposase